MKDAFAVVTNKGATSEDLAGAYFEIEQHKAKLDTDLSVARETLVKLKEEEMVGASNKGYKKQKEVFEEISFRIEVCDRKLETIKKRLVETLPAETRKDIEEAKIEKAALRQEEVELANKFLDLAAQAAVVQEMIVGERFHTGTNNAKYRVPDVDMSKVFHQDKQRIYKERFYHHKKANKQSGGGDSIALRENRLTIQNRDLERFLGEFNPEVGVVAFLEKFKKSNASSNSDKTSH